jgi:hypothetical protein
MREIRLSGSEGGGAAIRSPYPYVRVVHGFHVAPMELGKRIMVRPGFYKQAGPTDLEISASQVVVGRRPNFSWSRRAGCAFVPFSASLAARRSASRWAPTRV